MTTYKRMQIIKHALSYYVQRPDADKKDLETEKLLLAYYEDEVEQMKDKYHIKK